MKHTTLLKNATIITLTTPNLVIEGGAVLVRDGVIQYAGPSSQVVVEGHVDRVVDLRGKVLMPGLIIAHMHLYSTFARGMALKDAAPSNFVEILQRLWWRLDKALARDDIFHSAMISLVDCIKHGTTMVIDHHASPMACQGSLDEIERAFRETGVRGRTCYEVTDRDGEEIAHAGIDENLRFIEKCSHPGDDMVGADFGLHASFTLSDGTLSRCVETIKDWDVGFHVHVAEDRADLEDSLEKYGKSVVMRLADLGILGERSLAAHCVHVSQEDMELLRETKTNVVHNPQSNCGNAVGTADVIGMLERGVLVGLGSDGFTANLFDEIKTANILHKLVNRDPRVGSGEVLRMSLENNPRIAGKLLNGFVGRIEKGAYADLIAIEYHPPTPLTTDTFLGHLLFGLANASVNMTMVNGKILMEDGQLLHLDEEEIARNAREAARKLWERF